MRKIVLSLTIVLFNHFFVLSQANQNNEFDYVGKIHNEVITDFLKQYPDPITSIDEVLTKIKPIILKNKIYSEKFGHAYFNISEDEIKKYIPDASNNFSTLINDLTISSDSKKKLSELVKFVINASSYEEINSYTLNFEKELMNSKLIKSEKDLLLSLCSVSRHSSYLWLNQGNNTTAKVKWVWIVAADIVGGALGWEGGLAGVVTCASVCSTVAGEITGK